VRSEEPLTREQVEEKYGTTGGFRLPTFRTRGALLWVVLTLILAAFVLAGGLPGGGEGVNLRDVLKPFPTVPAPDRPPPRGVGPVAREVQQTWRELFRQAGIPFRPAKVVVVNRMANSECGVFIAAAADDAFYCHFDRKLMLDGGLSGAYPIAHTYAHHVQELLGITEQVARAERASPRQAHDLWRRHELQADCLAGVWAHSAYRRLDAAAAIERATLPLNRDHYIERESWAGAPREQRATWFAKGYVQGKPSACDTFAQDA
jgi:uncharacterized protein